MTVNELYSRIAGKGERDTGGAEAFELEGANNGVLLERLDKIERRILENRFIAERFRALARDSTLVSPKQLAEINAALAAQTKGLNYIEAVQRTGV